MTSVLKVLGRWRSSLQRSEALSLSLAVFVGMGPACGFAGQHPAATYEGFGGRTAGGDGRPVYYVTTLADSGPGSLRDALSQGDRYVRFLIAGEIWLRSRLYVSGANVTIDGFSAPAPGITLRNYGPFIHGAKGAHDVVVRGIRIRDTVAGSDGIQIARGAFNIVVDHVSIRGAGDGNLDITESRDVTVSWSIFAEPSGTQKNMLIKYHPARITLHHNGFIMARQRNPQVRIDEAGTPAAETTLDMRNNLIWGWDGGYGTLIWYGPRANVVRNFYVPGRGEPKQALVVSQGARAYLEGNVISGLSTDRAIAGSEGSAFPAPPVRISDACNAAHEVVSRAGAIPRDEADRRYLSMVSLPACPDTTPRPH